MASFADRFWTEIRARLGDGLHDAMVRPMDPDVVAGLSRRWRGTRAVKFSLAAGEDDEKTGVYLLAVSVHDPTALPPYGELFEAYVDKSAFAQDVLETLALSGWRGTDHVLLLGRNNYYLYDRATEEPLRAGDDLAELFPLVLPEESGAHRDPAARLAAIPRRDDAQRASEFLHWFDLAAVAIGGRAGVKPDFVRTLLQKVLVLVRYDLGFGLLDPGLSLRDHGPARGRAAERFDAVAWVHGASSEIVERHGAGHLAFTSEEDAFFSLLNGAGRDRLGRFALEAVRLSEGKFSPEIQQAAVCCIDDRDKLWRQSVTSHGEAIGQLLLADACNVYAPVRVDLEVSGTAWAFHVARQVVNHWRARCDDFERHLAREGRPVPVQFDFLQQTDPSSARLPRPADALRTAFESCLRVDCADRRRRDDLIYLLHMLVLGTCRETGLPPDALGALEMVFDVAAAEAELELEAV